MKLTALLRIFILSGALGGCDAISRKIESKRSDAVSCDAFKRLDNPIRTEDGDFKNGVRRFFAFGVYGFVAYSVTPGVSDPKSDLDQNARNLPYVNDPTTGPAERNSGDASYRITECGQKWIDWAAIYNKRLCANLHKVGQTSCEIHA